MCCLVEKLTLTKKGIRNAEYFIVPKSAQNFLDAARLFVLNQTEHWQGYQMILDERRTKSHS